MKMILQFVPTGVETLIEGEEVELKEGVFFWTKAWI
jgi:hypothetical protein